MASGRCSCQTAHHGTWPYIAFIKFRLIWSATVFWSIIELLIGELYNQGRCDRHARQLYGSVVGNSGDIFFRHLFLTIYDFFVPNFIFLRKWQLWRSVMRTLTDKSAQMHRQNWVFAGHTCPMEHFLLLLLFSFICFTAPDKVLFSSKKYWFFSYFSVKTSVVVLIRRILPRHF